MGNPDGGHIEDRAEVTSQSSASRMVSARCVDQYHVGLH
jgi:hypothetical protein